LTCASDSGIRVAGGPRAALEARSALAVEIGDHVGEGELRDLNLLLSEVVNNSVVHGKVDEDGWIAIAVAVEDEAVRIEVRDSGDQGQPVQREPDYDHGGGFGLFLVDAMASRWGVERETGLTVWFELDLPG
jgi:anti-sigma regulatory factor (Ser/Thr protein kinase)